MARNAGRRDDENAVCAPSGPVLLFDGVCNLCNAAVDFVLRHESAPVLRFASLQSPQGQQMLLHCGFPPDHLGSLVLIEGDRCYRSSLAVLRVARHMGGAWRLLWCLRVVPVPLRDALYEIVARHRYRLFGRREACRLPTPEERARFLG